MEYDSSTTSVFNLDKSVNCQARLPAIYVPLRKEGILEKALKDKNSFLEIVYGETNSYTDINIVQINVLD